MTEASSNGLVERMAQIAEAFADSEELGAIAGLAASTGVNSPGWVKDALHSHGQEVAKRIAASIRSTALQQDRPASHGMVKPLEAFAREMIRWAWDGVNGGAEIQEEAEKHGLIKRVPFDPAIHMDPNGYAEAGDWWFVFDGPLATPLSAEPEQAGATEAAVSDAVREAAAPIIKYLDAMDAYPGAGVNLPDDRFVAVGKLVGGFTFGDLRKLKAALSQSLSLISVSPGVVTDEMVERGQLAADALNTMIPAKAMRAALEAAFALVQAPSADAGEVEALAQIEEMLGGQGDDDGPQILPDFEVGMSTVAKVEACLFRLEKWRDLIDVYEKRLATPTPSTGKASAVRDIISRCFDMPGTPDDDPLAEGAAEAFNGGNPRLTTTAHQRLRNMGEFVLASLSQSSPAVEER